VIYSTVRPYLLNIAIVDQEFDPEPIASTAFGILHPFEGVNNRYLFYWLRSAPFTAYVHAGMKGMAYPAINDEKFYSGYIALPPLAEQMRIVAKVDELMALCDRLEAQQLEREAQARQLARASLARFTDAPTPANLNLLFHSSFPISPSDLRKSILDLAVQGKLVPQDANDQSAEDLAECRRAERKSEGIPDSWGLSSLSEVAEQIVDCPHSTPKWTSKGKVCVRTNQFRPGHLDLSATKFVSEQTFEDRIRRLRPKEDDILYSREGGILGIACRVPPNVELCLGQRMMLIRTGNSLEPSFLELVLNAPLITEIARRQTTGGAAPRVNVSTVKSYPIPIPPLAEQRRIVAKVSELMALVDELETQLAASRAAAEKLLSALVAELTVTTSRLPADS
jgi:type I restriction enzyme S subunit